MAPMLTLIEGGEVMSPEPMGVNPILAADAHILKIGGIDMQALALLDVPIESVDAHGCYVVPGFVDPHANVMGAGGEQGPASRMPELRWEDVVQGGITTIVGILGADAVTRNLRGVLGKVREFQARGLNAFMYTGAMQTPPPTLNDCIIDDLVLIPEVIGLGELAIADVRSTEPTISELARWVSQSYLGGTLSGKAGITRFHIGEGRHRLQLLRQLIDDYDIPPRCLHPTHITRTNELIPDAVALAKRGCYVDTDTVDPGTAALFLRYLEQGGPPERFTFSSDAQTPGGSPDKFYREFVDCVRRHRMPIDRVLPHFSTYTAEALKLSRKGRLKSGADADLLVIEKDSLRPRHVISLGKVLLRDGKPRKAEGGPP